MRKDKNLAARRTRRNRYHIRKGGKGRARLSVFRSSQNIYAQIIRDDEGKTVAAASTLEKDLRGKLKTGANIDAAKAVGELIAKRAQDAGVTASAPQASEVQTESKPARSASSTKSMSI